MGFYFAAEADLSLVVSSPSLFRAVMDYRCEPPVLALIALFK